MNFWQWQMHGLLVYNYCNKTQLVMKSITYQMRDLERFHRSDHIIIIQRLHFILLLHKEKFVSSIVLLLYYLLSDSRTLDQ